MWVLDLTTDLNIPSFAAVSRYTGRDKEYIIAGYRAHFDPKIAVSRAVTEVNQIGCHLPENYAPTDSDSALNYWFTQASIANQPYLAPAPAPIKLATDYAQQWSDDIYQDVLQCVEIVRQAGLEMLVLDQTRPDIGLPVVKVMYHYQPLSHTLNYLSDYSPDVEALVFDAWNSTGQQDVPQVIFIVTARFGRLFWKYDNIGYGLILKHVGVLYQTFYLVATAMQLAPSAIGAGKSEQFCQVAHLNAYEESSVGEFSLGSLKRSNDNSA